MSHFPFVTRAAAKPWAATLAATLALTLAGCGDDNIVAVTPAPPASAPTGAGQQATPSDASLLVSQLGIDGATGPALSASGVPTDAQIALRQAAIDGATSSGPGIDANQTALDANGEQPYKSF